MLNVVWTQAATEWFCRMNIALNLQKFYLNHYWFDEREQVNKTMTDQTIDEDLVFNIFSQYQKNYWD